MFCKKCKSQINDKYNFCPVCGKEVKPAKKKPAKRANGSGSVTRLSGNRSRPWMAEISSFKDGKRDRIIVGYRPTRAEALELLSNVARENITERYNSTLAQVYNEWKEIHFREIGASGKESYTTAWEKLAPLHSERMRNIKSSHFQKILDVYISADKSRSTCEKIKQLCSQLCKQAMQDDIIDKNYAQFVRLQKVEKKEKAIFTQEDISLLFKCDHNETARIILTLIYSGLRIGELFSIKASDVHLAERYMVGGEKTEAGKNRVVPINSKIFKYIADWLSQDKEYLITNTSGAKIDIHNFRTREYYPTLENLGVQKLNPHSTRHTFASLMSNANVQPDVLQKIIGHANYSTTAEIYIHKDIGQLLSAIEKI